MKNSTSYVAAARGIVVASANVNGIRAAVRRGMGEWVAKRQPDVLCLQEVRAADSDLVAALGDSWHYHHAVCDQPGRSGVAVMSAVPVLDTRIGVGDEEFATSGRWIETDLRCIPTGGKKTLPITVISSYFPKGMADSPRQESKYRFLAAASARLQALAATGRDVLLTGDLNIAHQEIDLKAWRANQNHSGFLPAERAWLTELLAEGWVDVVRALAGNEEPGPYTWWSWRGKAFDNDAGWRIDYHLATPKLASLATDFVIDKAPSYAQRWSDHAPVTVTYDMSWP